MVDSLNILILSLSNGLVRILVRLLFGPTALWIPCKEIMSETSIKSVGLIKYEPIFAGGRKSKGLNI